MAGRVTHGFVPVSQVADVYLGGTPSRAVLDYWNGPYWWATAKDVAGCNSSRYLHNTAERITRSGLDNSAAKLLPRDTIVITARGTVGALCMLAEDMSFNQTCYGLVAKKGYLPAYLYYALKASLAQIDTLSYGTVFSTITIKTFDSLMIPDMKIPEQQAIACILGALDDKIELNRRMNQTLEAMARAIFKSWFVDFDPVRAKAAVRREHPRWAEEQVSRAACPKLKPEIAELFPDRLVDSELGEIPEGWRVGKFSDVAEHLRDSENPLDSPDVVFSHFSIPAFDDGQWPKQELGKNIKSLKLRVRPGVVLLSKLNPEIERVWLVDVEPSSQAICSTEFLVLVPRAPHGRAFVYCLARSPLFRQGLVGLVTGTSKSHQRAQVDSILGLAVPTPLESLLSRFEDATKPILTRILECRRESRTLAALRDTLLPKLISGELRVPDAERIVGRCV